MSVRTQDVLTVYALALVCAVGLWTASCTEGGGVTLPSPDEATEPAEVAGSGVTPTAPSASADSWEFNGLKVEVIFDEWGPGSCHDNGGLRKFRLTNNSNVTKYSRLAAFTDDVPRCGTQKTETGVPNHGGCTTIDPGQTCEYWVRVTMPKGTDGVCTLQTDDTWGPGNFREGSFVVGDSFKVPDAQCKKICIEDPTTTKKTVCEPWPTCDDNNCGKVTRQCVETTTIDYLCKPDLVSDRKWTEEKDCPCECAWEGEFCTTYLSNSGTGYYTTDDGARWLQNLTLSRGNQNTCWPHYPDGSRLCLFWQNERIGCANATKAVTASWHGNVRFNSRCVYPD